jgi:long-chain acyl-CoA synthetase
LYLLGATACGASNVIHGSPTFDAREVLGLIQAKGVTSISFMAPTQVVRLLDACEGFDTSSLRSMTYGGAPILGDQARDAIRRFGPILCQSYGQGEAPAISCLQPDEHTDDMVESAGRPRINIEVKILDGEVVVRGDVVTCGYWRNPEATSAALKDGWLHTGDLGHIDERGVISLHGRKGDVIISGGTNIYPLEVENILIQHPQVQDVSVFGAPDDEWGENVVAAVVPAGPGPVDPEDLRAFCKEHLASFKKPRDVIVMDALPRNAYGKVLRQHLRDSYAGQCK